MVLPKSWGPLPLPRWRRRHAGWLDPTAVSPRAPGVRPARAAAGPSARAGRRRRRESPKSHSPWRTSYFPYLSGKANDGPVISARIRYWQPAPYEARTTYTAALDAAAGVSFRGTRYAAVRFRAPGLWKDWRLDAFAGRGASGTVRVFRAGERHRAQQRSGRRGHAFPLQGPPHPIRRAGRGHPPNPGAVPGGAAGPTSVRCGSPPSRGPRCSSMISGRGWSRTTCRGGSR